MNTVTIRVLTEDGIGVPNLVTVLYDLDKLTPPNPNDPTPATNEDWGFWSQFHGDRLGSQITDRDGDAEFKFEDSDFALTQSEKRPDLVLFILAPERYFQDVQGLPTATPPAQQIIHRSEIARGNAGRQEAYVVEINSERLAKFNLRVPRDRLAADREKIAEAAVSGWVTKKAIDEKLRPYIQEDFEKIKASRKKALEVFKDFRPSRTSKTERQSALFVTSKEELPAARDKAIENGLKRMEGYRAPFTLNVSREEVARHGISLGSDDTSTARITLGSAFELISAVISGAALVRGHVLRDLCGDCVGELPTGSNGGNGSGGGVDTPTTSPGPTLPISLEDARQEITNRVVGQVADLKTWDPNTIDKIANLESVWKAVHDLELNTGPADVDAFYDFHSLQIAFDHVWTEAYDEDIARLGRSVLEHVDQIRDGLGFSENDTSTGEAGIDSVDDLTEWLDYLGAQLSSTGEIPTEVRIVFSIGDKEFWVWLGTSRQATLTDIAVRAAGAVTFFSGGSSIPGSISQEVYEWRLRIEQWKMDYNSAITAGIYRPPSTTTPLSNITQIISELREHLLEKYAFKVFAPDSYNYGLLLTYRQKWRPETYQVGDLVSTIPLAPGETRKYTKRRTMKRTRAEKEIENALSIRRSESSMTSRAQVEILRKASLQSNFQYTANESLKDDAGPSSTTTFGMNISRDSSENKQDFHEAVLKAAEEYKRENTLEVSSTFESEFEETFAGEISNPNNEIPVTYLFYELQRRYLVSEQIHKVTPVILVAQDVPAPHEIDEAWLLTHEWILRRVLLDDSFRSALDYLKDGLASDEYAVAVIRDEWIVQRDLVQKIQAQVADVVASQNILRGRLNEAIQRQAESQGVLEDVVEGLFGTGDDDREVARARVEAAQSALDFNQQDLADAKNRLVAAQSAYRDATRKLTEATQKQLNRRIAVNQLRAHVKDNIIYYMQAVWDHEVPDQRFFRLYDLEVVVPTPPTGSTDITFLPTMVGPAEIEVVGGGEGVRVEGIIPPAPPLHIPGTVDWQTKTLVEIADIDRPLGYKGNYIILPLKESNYLTTFMSQEFIHGYFGVWDPDVEGNYRTSDLVDCVECTRRKVADGEATPEQLRRLEEILRRRLLSPRRLEDRVIVPSNQLYIEALPGAHPVLEKFKLLHRAIDVGKAVAETRGLELENLRRAARLVHDPPQLDDPNIDRKVVVQGDVETNIET